MNKSTRVNTTLKSTDGNVNYHLVEIADMFSTQFNLLEVNNNLPESTTNIDIPLFLEQVDVIAILSYINIHLDWMKYPFLY